MTAAQIAAELEISQRTVYRYIDALSASGVPVVAEAGPEGGYSLPDQFRAAPLFFEAQELLALSQAGLFAVRLATLTPRRWRGRWPRCGVV